MFAVFTRAEGEAIAAAAARIFPSDELGPGATEAGVVFFVDRALAGHDAGLRDAYRRGVEMLERLAHKCADRHFSACTPDVQDEVLREVEADPDSSFFFQCLIEHTREGLFSDPVHGGNREMVGWRLLGHPGVQLGYSDAELAPGATIERAPRSLAEFQRERGV